MDTTALGAFMDILDRVACSLKFEVKPRNGLTEKEFLVFVMMGCLYDGAKLENKGAAFVCDTILAECGKSEEIVKMLDKCDSILKTGA